MKIIKNEEEEYFLIEADEHKMLRNKRTKTLVKAVVCLDTKKTLERFEEVKEEE